MGSDDFKTIILQKNIYVTDTCPSFDFGFCIIAHDLQYWTHSESGSVGGTVGRRSGSGLGLQARGRQSGGTVSSELQMGQRDQIRTGRG